MVSSLSVIGLGYIGLPTATLFALNGVRVNGLDANANVVESVNNGKIHIVEPGLDSAVQTAVERGLLSASLEAQPADAFVIAVPTPFIGTGKEPDLQYIKAASFTIAPVLKPGNLIVLESTSPVGTTEQMVEWLAEARPDLSFPHQKGEASDIRVAYCPERVLPGQILNELVSNDRIIGGMTPACSKAAVDLYKVFVEGNCVITTNRVAEMTKLAENSFRDVNIAFANELSILCDKLNIDVWELISMANRHPRVNILQPGPGVGGHCIAVDPWFIVSQNPAEAQLISAARKVNDGKPTWVIDKVHALLDSYLTSHKDLNPNDVSIACYGLAFKPNVDDLRESPALSIVKRLKASFPAKIIAVEPNITKEKALGVLGADIEFMPTEAALSKANLHIVLVAHDEFKKLEFPEKASFVATGI